MAFCRVARVCLLNSNNARRRQTIGMEEQPPPAAAARPDDVCGAEAFESRARRGGVSIQDFISMYICIDTQHNKNRDKNYCGFIHH